MEERQRENPHLTLSAFVRRVWTLPIWKTSFGISSRRTRNRSSIARRSPPAAKARRPFTTRRMHSL